MIKIQFEYILQSHAQKNIFLENLIYQITSFIDFFNKIIEEISIYLIMKQIN